MTIRDAPERPDVKRALWTGYPKRPKYPRCPVCGQDCWVVYRAAGGEIVGCSECIRYESAWNAEECFEEGRK